MELQTNPRRPVVHLSLDCTPFGNKLKDGAAALEKAAGKLIEQNNVPAEAAVALRLTGRINLGRIALDLLVAAQHIEQSVGVKAVALDATAINIAGGGSAVGAGETVLKREEIERASIRSLVDEENLWGLDGEQANVASLFYELKEGVRENKTPERLAELVQLSRLVDRICATPQTDGTLASVGTWSTEGVQL
jgi:hypothetical protein